MKFTFLGTRGEIEARSRRPGRPASVLVASGSGRVRMSKGVMIDCGEDWLEIFQEINPGGIVLTHAHPDHAWGLREGSHCPVWATEETWAAIDEYPIADRHIVRPREKFEVMGLTFEAFPVDHSVRCPAVCYRVSDGEDASVLYAPDVVAIKDRTAAMKGVDVYVGDAATLTTSFVRKVGEGVGTLVGHTTVQAQIGWCRAENVERAVFTHCGMEVTTAPEGEAEEAVRRLGLDRGVEAVIAFDGMELSVKG
jgi:phosphoribosyl 1,2-cyclic phosphodiesterase